MSGEQYDLDKLVAQYRDDHPQGEAPELVVEEWVNHEVADEEVGQDSPEGEVEDVGEETEYQRLERLRVETTQWCVNRVRELATAGIMVQGLGLEHWAESLALYIFPDEVERARFHLFVVERQKAKLEQAEEDGSITRAKLAPPMVQGPGGMLVPGQGNRAQRRGRG